MAANPDIGAVLSELVETSAGHEIYMRRPEHLGIPLNTPVTFEEVCPRVPANFLLLCELPTI